jgi:hypothetical protein
MFSKRGDHLDCGDWKPTWWEWLRSLWQLSCWLPRWDTRGADRYYTVDGALVAAVGARVALA